MCISPSLLQLLAMFSEAEQSDLLSFLLLDEASSATNDKPYVWSNTLRSFDGIISTGPDSKSPS